MGLELCGSRRGKGRSRQTPPSPDTGINKIADFSSLLLVAAIPAVQLLLVYSARDLRRLLLSFMTISFSKVPREFVQKRLL